MTEKPLNVLIFHLFSVFIIYIFICIDIVSGNMISLVVYLLVHSVFSLIILDLLFCSLWFIFNIDSIFYYTYNAVENSCIYSNNTSCIVLFYQTESCVEFVNKYQNVFSLTINSIKTNSPNMSDPIQHSFTKYNKVTVKYLPIITYRISKSSDPNIHQTNSGKNIDIKIEKVKNAYSINFMKLYISHTCLKWCMFICMCTIYIFLFFIS